MIKTAGELNYRIKELKRLRDKANGELDEHLSKCILCQIEKQSALKIACMEGRRLIERYAEASKDLRGI